MKLTDSETNKPSKLIILLLHEGEGIVTAFASLTNLPFSPAYTSPITLLKQVANTVTLCSRQQLLQNHLTVHEHICLVSSLYGHRETLLINQCIDQTSLKNRRQERIKNLSKTQSRLLSLLLALLPGPDLLLIDDLTDGLSMPACHEVWQFLQRILMHQECVTIYATQSLQIVHNLEADEVWFLDEKKTKSQWFGDNLPPLLSASAAFVFDFDMPKSATRFLQTIQSYPNQFGLLHSVQAGKALHTVKVFVDMADRLVNLMLAAGQSLVNIHTIPLRVDELPVGWMESSPPTVRPATQPKNEILGETNLTEPHITTLTKRQKCRVLLQISISEWRRHFRSFFGFGNILFSNLLPLGLLNILWQSLNRISLTDFYFLAAITLTSSAAMIIGWSTEALNRLAIKAHCSKSGLSGRCVPSDAKRPFSTLALFDLTPTGRPNLLRGLLLGQCLILLSHACPLLLLWFFVFPTSQFLLVSLLFWLLIAIEASALAILLGKLVHSSGKGHFIGWIAYLSLLLSGMVILWVPERWEALIWFWPVIGFTEAFIRFFDPETSPIAVLGPLLPAFAVTAWLWWAAIRSFCRRPAVWQAEKLRT